MAVKELDSLMTLIAEKKRHMEARVRNKYANIAGLLALPQKAKVGRAE